MVASLVGWIGGFGYLAHFGKWLIAACAFAGGLVGFLTALRWMLDEANGTHDND